MKVHIPNSAFLGNIDSFLDLFQATDPSKLEISANKKWFSIHPVVLTMIVSLGLSIPRGNIHCEKLESKSKHYLHRMGLLKWLGLEETVTINEHDPSGRFIPLTQIRNSKNLVDFIRDMIPLLHLPEAQASPIKYVVSELVRNVLEHADSPHGAIVCAQYYKKSNSIRFGISDAGVGLRRTICQSHRAATDLEAIRLALTPGVTGTTSREGGTDYNAGAGLFFIKSIAKVNRNFFMIYSGNTMYKLLKRPEHTIIRLFADPFEDKHSKRTDLPYWQGTVIGVDISLDNTLEFSSLLDLIRNTYVKSVRERKRQRYKKPRFI